MKIWKGVLQTKRKVKKVAAKGRSNRVHIYKLVFHTFKNTLELYGQHKNQPQLYVKIIHFHRIGHLCILFICWLNDEAKHLW